MTRLSPGERAVLHVVKRWQQEYRNSPNAAEIARAIGRNVSAVYYALYGLQEKGFIDLLRPDRRLVIFPLYWE